MNSTTAVQGAAASPRPPEADTVWRALVRAASRRYQNAGPFAWRFARGKLTHDPVFRYLLSRGLFGAAPRIVDIGCGQGLLCNLLDAVHAAAGTSGWPLGWAAAPRLVAYTGIELMARDVQRATQSLPPRTHTGADVRFVCADMREAALPACDVVVILDVLHYVDHAAQATLLARVRQALGPATATPRRLLLRVGDQAQSSGYAISQWVDRVVTRIRGHQVAPTWGRPVTEWTALLQSQGFTVVAHPMSQGTPFANVLLVAELRTP